MFSGSLLSLVILALIGFEEAKGSPPPVLAVTKTAPAEAAGAIMNRPFKPDRVTLYDNSLAFRTGKGFLPDMEVEFRLPKSDGRLEGKEWTFVAQKTAPKEWKSSRDGEDFYWVEQEPSEPWIGVRTHVFGLIPWTETVSPGGYTMSLKIVKQTRKTIEGTIDLRVTKPANTYLAGKFTAEIEKTPLEPLDADDSPYVQGKITILGQWQTEILEAGFIGKGTDGNEYSNLAGTDFSPGQGGGCVTCGTCAPQLTSIFSRANGDLGFNHTKMAPGEYLVFVSRRGFLAAWKIVTVKPGDRLTVDLTIDPAKMGSVVVTFPDGETRGEYELLPSLVPLEFCCSITFGDHDIGLKHPFFSVREAKKGSRPVTLKELPAGKYRLVDGKSQVDVEVSAGKETAVTLRR